MSSPKRRIETDVGAHAMSTGDSQPPLLKLELYRAND